MPYGIYVMCRLYLVQTCIDYIGVGTYVAIITFIILWGIVTIGILIFLVFCRSTKAPSKRSIEECCNNRMVQARTTTDE